MKHCYPDFYSNLNLEDICDENGKIFWKKFRIKTLGEYHDLYIQSHALILADIFDIFGSFFFDTRINLASSFEKLEVLLKLITVAFMLLIIEKDIKDGICYVIHLYAEATDK